MIGIARDIDDTQEGPTKAPLDESPLPVLDQMAIGIAFVNREWRFTFINSTALNYLQLTLERALSTRLWELFPGLQNTEFATTYRRAMDDGEMSATRGHYEPLGVLFEASAFPTSDGIWIQLWDVTHDRLRRVQLEETMSDLRDRAALLDAARDAIYMRGLDGRITYWNKGAKRVFGWPSQNAVGALAVNLLAVDVEAFHRATAHVLRFDHWDGELEKVTMSGRVLIVECRWQLVRDEAGEPTGIFSVDTDITEWKRDEDRRNRAQRMESVGKLAGGIAHDLNNVLTPILLSSQLLAVGETDPRRRALFDSIATSVNRGADMARQVLSFARGVEGERVPLDVGALLAQVADFCSSVLPESIRFEVDAPERLWTVTGDQTQLFQVLVNLVTNARDSMQDGGRLTIRAQNLGKDAAAPESRRVVIEVEDNGTGMDAPTVSQVFDPFFTTKRTGSGTGLGLSTSMTIIRDHGGELDVHSEPGFGSRFHISLPASEGEVPVSDARSTSQVVYRGGNECVLVVDDDETIREVACLALRAAGYQTVAAANGLEAMALLERGSVSVDLVFTDMMMPEMDGAELAAYLEARHPCIAVIAASGANATAATVREVSTGVTHLISKPFTTSALITAVRESLDSRGSEDE